MVKSFSLPLVLLGLLLLFSLGIKLYFIGEYPVYEDEAISILAAEGIVQHGTPLLPSGFLYPRDFLHQYLLALPLALFGTDEFSARILSVLFSLVTVLGVYLLVSHRAGPWGGILAATVLVFSSMEMSYALSARMYSQYQMFTVFAVYGFIRGFIERVSAYKWLCLLSMAGLLLSHKLGVLVLGVLALYLLVRDRLRLFHDPFVRGGTLLLIPLVYFVESYRFSNEVVSVTGLSWRTQSMYALGEPNWESLTYYIHHVFGEGLPWSIGIFLIGLGWTFYKKDRTLALLYAVVLIPTLGMSLFDYKHPNYLFNLFAVYTAVVFIVLLNLWNFVRDGIERTSPAEGSEVSQGEKGVPAWIFQAAGIFLMAGYILIMGVRHHPAYGFQHHRADERPAHEFVKEHLQPGDVVITSNPWVTHFYLRNFDFFIRQKYSENRSWGPFPVERDEYYDKGIVDTLPELQGLLENPAHRRVWIIMDGKFFAATGREMIVKVFGNFRPVYGGSRNSPAIVGLYRRGM